MSTEPREIAVVGGGAMGSATAWQLARRGHDVVLLERFGPGHTHGASHGSRRNFNLAYTEPEYLGMLRESARLWRELEAESGMALLELAGLVDHGDEQRSARVHGALRDAGMRAEWLPPHEASRRWPGMRFDTRVLVLPDAGTVRADDAVMAMQQAAVAGGAEVRHGHRVVGITADEGGASLDLEVLGARITLHVKRVVVTAGAWTARLLGGVVPVPRLTITHEQPAHFAPRYEGDIWPSFNHRRSAGAAQAFWPASVYGLFDPGEGVKAGWHGAGPVMDPEDPRRPSDAGVRAALQRYAREWLPGVDPDSAREISCTYTSTDDGHFVIDRVGQMVIGAGFSGHGFKFTPAVGRMLADLATGDGTGVPLFSASR